MSLSECEWITLLMMRGWGDNERLYEAVKNLCNDTFQRDILSLRRPTTVTDKAASSDVLQSFAENPNESVRSAAETHEMSRESVRRVLKKAAFMAYRVHLIQELNEVDFDRRLECEVMQPNWKKIRQKRTLSKMKLEDLYEEMEDPDKPSYGA
ncbi:hypothetical protein J6590_076240 [Homalodisca vitripennis]|nr:hypothetical protein J6590_076240 [Homalodisca vitripennis]